MKYLLHYTRRYVGYTLCGTCCSMRLMNSVTLHHACSSNPLIAERHAICGCRSGCPSTRLNYFRLSSATWHRAVFCGRILTFLHPYSSLQCKSPISTLLFHAWTKSFSPYDEGRMFLETSVSTRLHDIKTYKTTIWQFHAGKHEKWTINHVPLQSDILQTGSADSRFSVMTLLDAWWKRNLGLYNSRDYLFPQRADRLCGLSSLLFSVYWDIYFQMIKQCEHKAGHSFPFRVEVKGALRFTSTSLYALT